MKHTFVSKVLEPKLISIITINLNNAFGLKNTIKSVDSQKYKNYELIVIDGLSSDESLDIIKQNEEIISKKLIEKDEGLYDAMNKGVNLASGDYALFLNSGDIFNNSYSLKIMVDSFDKKEKLYFGRARIRYKNKPLYYIPSLNITDKNYKQDVKTCHQSVFFPKSFYKKNYYNLDYKIAADMDYKLRALKLFEYKFIDTVIVDFELGGISSVPKSFKFWREIINEVSTIRNKSGFKNQFSLFLFLSKYYTKYITYKILGEESYFKLIGYFISLKK